MREFLTLISMVFCVALSLLHSSISYAQITNIDNWRRAHIDKERISQRDTTSVCHQRGFEIFSQSLRILDIELGTQADTLNALLLAEGFNAKRNVGWGSGGRFRPHPFKCGQSGYSIVEYCKKNEKADQNLIQVTVATLSEIELDGQCIYGLSSEMKIKEYETHASSMNRPIKTDWLSVLELKKGMPLQTVHQQLIEKGWEDVTSDFLMKAAPQTCIKNDDGWVITATRDYKKISQELRPIIQNARLYFSAECDGDNIDGLGGLRTGHVN